MDHRFDLPMALARSLRSHMNFKRAKSEWQMKHCRDELRISMIWLWCGSLQRSPIVGASSVGVACVDDWRKIIILRFDFRTSALLITEIPWLGPKHVVNIARSIQFVALVPMFNVSIHSRSTANFVFASFCSIGIFTKALRVHGYNFLKVMNVPQ